jgi:hypothetical protein
LWGNVSINYDIKENYLPTSPVISKPDIDKVELGYVEPGHGMKFGYSLLQMSVECIYSIKANPVFVFGAIAML